METLQIENENEINHFPQLPFWKLFIEFLIIGINAWGGPVASINLLKEKFVIENKWSTNSNFNRIYSIYQILPGPSVTGLCIFFGCLSRGRIGGVIAGIAFIIPGFCLMLLFCYIYYLIGSDNIYFNASFHSLQPTVGAIVLKSVHKFSENFLISNRDGNFNKSLFYLCILSLIQNALHINFFITLFLFGVIYTLIDKKYKWTVIIILSLQYIGYITYVIIKGYPSSFSFGFGIAKVPNPESVFALSLLTGSISFGGAYVTIPFVETEAVIIGKWISEKTFLNGIAIGQILPAPLSIFCTFVGFQGGYTFGKLPYAFLNSILMTLGVFLPQFILSIVFHNYLEKLITNNTIVAFFEGITSAVIGIISITALNFLKNSINQDPISAVIYIVSLSALYNFQHKYTHIFVIIISLISGQFLFRN